MSSSRPRIRPAFRVIAAGCAVVWLLATSYCSIEHLLETDRGSRDEGNSGAVAAASADQRPSPPAGRVVAARTRDARSEKPASRHDNDSDDVCCSNLHATAQIPQQLTGDQLVLHQPSAVLGVLLDARELATRAPANQFNRQARRRDWVFTPEVCLGPAFRSLAPPLSSVS
jgi:hypothetical protein